MKLTVRPSCWSMKGIAAGVAVATPLFLCGAPASAETRGYVISWFATATNNPDFTVNCPKAVADPSSRYQTTGTRRVDRAVVNGIEVSPFDYPDAVVKDPDIEPVSGKYAYGFDLGGPEATKFIDPETGEKVDNQLWRAVGCASNFQFTPPTMPYMEGQAWTSGYADSAPAWAMQVTGDDLGKDGPVTVTLDRTLSHLVRDAKSAIRSHVTYVLDPSPRSHNVLAGEIKNGVLLIKSGSVWLQGSAPFYIQIDLENAHMRMRTETGSKIVGYWGGYTDWRKWSYLFTSRCGGGFDCIGIYHGVKKLADWDPDPATGQNRKISITWRMEAVPAFLATPDGKILATASTDGLGGRIHDSVPPRATAQNTAQ